MKRICLIIVMICSPAVYSASNSAVGTITKISVGASWMRVATTSMNNNEGCANNSWFKLNFGDDPKSAMYSSILAAKAAKQEIYFQVSEFIGGYPKITHVFIN